MKIHTLLAFVLASVASVHPAQAAGRVIARVNGGAGTINSICVSLSCTVTQSIGDPLGQLYVITSTTADTQTLVSQFSALAAIIDCEPDQVAHAAASTYTPPAALTDTRTVDYFGVAVPHGYLSQPAVG